MPNITVEQRNGDVWHISMDEQDYQRCVQYRWYVTLTRHFKPYAYGVVEEDGVKRRVSMHRWILGVHGEGFPVVDHVDGNGLNNHRDNLRLRTQAENAQNLPLRSHPSASSQYRGVRKTKSGRYEVNHTIGGVSYFGGLWDDELEAARYAAAWRVRYMSNHGPDDVEFSRGYEGEILKSVERKAKRTASNQSSVAGVTWVEGRSKWTAEVTIKGIAFNLGHYEEEDEAVAARRKGLELRREYHAMDPRKDFPHWAAFETALRERMYSEFRAEGHRRGNRGREFTLRNETLPPHPRAEVSPGAACFVVWCDTCGLKEEHRRIEEANLMASRHNRQFQSPGEAPKIRW